jgi:hypothetical protein
MQKRAGLLYLAKSTGRILLILENSKWTVPTFERKSSLLDDVVTLFDQYVNGRIIPIDLYMSIDNGFEYGTYICLVDVEFVEIPNCSFAWCSIDCLPLNLHPGLKKTLLNQINKTKIETILKVVS